MLKLLYRPWSYRLWPLILETVRVSKRRKSITSKGMRTSPFTNRWSQTQRELIHTGTVLILSVCLFVCLSICLSACLPVCPSIYLSIHEQMISDTARTNTYNTPLVQYPSCLSVSMISDTERTNTHRNRTSPVCLSVCLSICEQLICPWHDLKCSKIDAYWWSILSVHLSHFLHVCVTPRHVMFLFLFSETPYLRTVFLSKTKWLQTSGLEQVGD